MTDVTTIVKRLRALGLSQNEIARRLGIPQSRVWRWEQGGVPDSVNDALRLLELLKLAEKGKLPKPPKAGAESGPSSPASANPANHPASTASTTPSEA